MTRQRKRIMTSGRLLAAGLFGLWLAQMAAPASRAGEDGAAAFAGPGPTCVAGGNAVGDPRTEAAATCSQPELPALLAAAGMLSEPSRTPRATPVQTPPCPQAQRYPRCVWTYVCSGYSCRRVGQTNTWRCSAGGSTIQVNC